MSVSIIRAISYAGVYVGAVIGAGYASGQEVLQFFAGYGFIGMLGAVITMIMLAWYGTVFMELGHQLKTNSHRVVLNYLCGKKIGFFADYILLFFMFGVISIMFSGGGAAIHQYWGLPAVTGKIIIALMTLSTVIFGFTSSVRALGIISPLMILAVVVISVITFTTYSDQLATVDATIQLLNPDTATPFWWTSAIVYVSYNVIPGVSTFASIGNKEPNLKTVRMAGIIGGLTLGICLLFIIMALLSNLENVMSYELPFLEIARNIGPTTGLLFSIVLVVAVFTTAVSNLYGFVIRFFDSDTETSKFRILTVVVVVLSLLASLFPFSTLVGTLYPALGILGMYVLICALYKTFKGQIFMAERPKL
ncbi:beta-carotene 15,15'-monooxygenase [Psychrobacter sp. TAE2020]|uniref:YkvI family membrane protein n=1 Tax=Psychrobacter sp. TAE2020 TaxID=2846762 RepID=UPI001C126048|nr:beta-carotene 15,15'-monooxygenase [Psychrobacter sp. TAE2020]MBU5618015.1 beta-carotene 15,15'-monooxygenase [Psychrobacter sp. TAE2020]